ncbi:MAG TPA: helix-turn-helix domain-containing protein [Ignavibacteria bacterium]|nr:helix-turn-helix domain-containing protein [Ignavibacteria bacterium]HMQ97988.1 helix-turn-helix domain-containing protein [Ignavibacteria bacterium]
MLKEFGQDLKKLRELKGISIAEISAESRINTKFLQLLENGNFDFQPETYIRSFIKAYARALNENENQILNDYDKAKAGFYARRKFADENSKDISAPDAKLRISVLEQPSKKEEDIDEPVYSKGIESDKPDYMKSKPAEINDTPEYSNRSITQKILLGLLIAAIVVGIYFLIDYLNNSGEKKTEVKPKSFNEISSEYENKISNKMIDSARIKDSLKTLAELDSLTLTVKAIKDIKIKLYIDEDAEAYTENLSAKDSIVFKAKEKFRFSASTSHNVDLFLNGKYLKKSGLTPGTSIKNLIITKEGILQQ